MWLPSRVCWDQVASTVSTECPSSSGTAFPVWPENLPDPTLFLGIRPSHQSIARDENHYNQRHQNMSWTSHFNLRHIRQHCPPLPGHVTETTQWNMDGVLHTCGLVHKTLQHRILHTLSPLAGQMERFPRMQRRAKLHDGRSLGH
ncbi:uncharacterized protein LOC132672693 [Panthera onca]